MLERLGVSFTVRASGVPELEQGEPRRVVVENARRKAVAVREPGRVVLACDTVVALDGVLYGKPTDQPAARATLLALSGRTHEVLSAAVVLLADGERVACARTEVSMRALDDRLLDWYLAREEWRGRAGGYAIQGAGAALVSSISGDYENVVGLPLAALLDVYPELLAGR
jgi:nucleoside triphosphate pyrophosphatase